MKKSLIRRCLNRVLNVLARSSPGAKTVRPFLHRLRGVKIGAGVFIGDGVYFDNEYPESIEIQDRVQINIRTILIAHTRGPGRIIVESDAFVGAGSIIACSSGRIVRIGRGAVIGAGAVITKSVPPALYVAPPPPQCVARVELPLTLAETMDSFQAGLRPLKKPATQSEGAPAPSSPHPANPPDA